MVGRSKKAWAETPVVLPATNTPQPRGKSASIVRLPRALLPPMSDYARACAALIWDTFPASSQRAVCERAARETGLASADTFARIVAGETRKPDGYLMHCVSAIAAMRGVSMPAALVIRASE